VLAIAHEQHRVLVTIDTDFGELAVVKGQLHHGIIRIDDLRAHEFAQAVQDALSEYADELNAGGIVICEAGRMRLRRAPRPE